MQKVLILGCGYLGYNLAAALSSEYSVTIAGHQNEYSERLIHLEVGVNWLNWDLNKPEGLDAVLLEDVIIINAIGSLGTEASVEEAAESFSFCNLVSRLLLYLNNKRVRRFIQISSGGTVYGCPIWQPIPETAPTDPLTNYALQKVIIEQLIKINFLENGQLPYSILRVGNPFGGFQVAGKKQGAIPIFIRNMLKSNEISLWANRDTIRDFIYISDFVFGVRLMLEYNGIERVFNLATGIGTSIEQVIKTISEQLGQAPIIREVSNHTPPIPKNVLDISKLGALGFEPRVSFSDGIRHEINRILLDE